MSGPIKINPSAVMAHGPVLLRQLALILLGSATIIGFLGRQDMAGLWAWLQTDDGAKLVATVGTLATLAYGQFRAHDIKTTLVTLGRKVDDETAIVTEPSPPPAVAPADDAPAYDGPPVDDIPRPDAALPENAPWD